MIHFILHIFGLDTQNGVPYMFWSGVGAKIDLLFLGLLYVVHHNCHVKGCLRMGHPVNGAVYCRKHAHVDNPLSKRNNTKRKQK